MRDFRTSFEDVEQTARPVLDSVLDERARQHQKWGHQIHAAPLWLAILGEEFGEACQAALWAIFSGHSIADFEHECIQVAAVAVAIVEGIRAGDVSIDQERDDATNNKD